MDLSNFSSLQRLTYYKETGFTADAFDDLDYRVRIAAYYTLGYTQDALHDESAIIRWNASLFFNKFDTADTSLYYLQNYYRMTGYSKDLCNHTNDWVRHEAQQIFGYTIDGLTDPYLPIRIECYRIFGFPIEAYADPDTGVRHEAYLHNGFPAAALVDSSPILREIAVEEYIKNNSK